MNEPSDWMKKLGWMMSEEEEMMKKASAWVKGRLGFYFLMWDTYVKSVKRLILHIILLSLAQFVLAQSLPEKATKKDVQSKSETADFENLDIINGFDGGTLLDEARTKAGNEPETAIDLIERILNLGYRKNRDDPALNQQAYFLLGKIYMDLGRYEAAVNAFEQARSIRIRPETKKRSSRKQSAKVSSTPALDPMTLAENLSMAYEKNGDTKNAEKWLEEFLQQAKKRNDGAAQIRANNRYGDYWTAQGSPKQAEAYYNDAIFRSNEINDRRGYVNSLDGLGRNFQVQQNTNQARQNYYLKKEVAEELEDDTLVAQAYEQIAETFEEENNLDSALFNENQALATLNRAGDTLGELRKKNKISSLYLRKDEADEAIDILQESLTMAEKLGEVDAQAKAHELLAEGYEKKGRVEQALFHQKKANVLQDSLAIAQAQQFKSLLSQNEQIAAKDKRILALEKEKDLQNSLISNLKERQSFQQRMMFILGIGFLVVSISAFLVIRSNQARRKANQLLALKSLRSQMNPHFIFNSLNSINGFIARHDDRTANKYLSDFSKLMRTVLDHSQQDFVSLGTELEVIKLYVKLEHFRFGDKFDYELNIDPELRQDQVEIPPMLIQPYIENAIWHGLRYKPEKGYMKIDIEGMDNALLVRIEDDGIGRKQSALLKTRNQKSHKSTGLKNTAQRVNIINELYQASLSVEIEDLHPEEEHTGTRVLIQMPLRIKED